MVNDLLQTITSEEGAVRNRSISHLLQGKSREELIHMANSLESFRKTSENLYHRVRASLFLSVLYRFYLAEADNVRRSGTIPFAGIQAAYERDFERAIGIFLREIHGRNGGNSTVYSAIADSYYHLSFNYLLDQVKLSISGRSENYHLYHVHDIEDYPFRVPEELITPDPDTGRYPIGMDASPIRIDPSHSGWSDIFFLGMDFPEGARVINFSVDLRIHGSDSPLLPPCECYCRYIPEPVVLLTSVDLAASKKIQTLDEIFNFGNDYLSLLKAGVVASGVVPPCFEGRDIPLPAILRRLLNKPGGIEIVTRVNGIPKGSRLAVSTTLLATIIARLMRFSGQISTQTGGLRDDERRVVASRAILGEWLGGSGGGWQDSGGLWPGIKIIRGRLAREGNPEYGISRGCLLPEHNIFTREEISWAVEQRIHDSLVLVHGGISQDVGPILEMVTEKYLLKYEREWNARLRGLELFDGIVSAIRAGDMKLLGQLTTQDWEESIQQVIPWVNNAFTEELIDRAKTMFGDDYWGFLMLGGMSGGGMAFIVNPHIKEDFRGKIHVVMRELKDKYRSSYPFIIDPVVYDFAINHDGITATLRKGALALLPQGQPVRSHAQQDAVQDRSVEEEIRQRFGFDERAHAYMTSMLRRGDIGLEKNRLPLTTRIEDVMDEDILHGIDTENMDMPVYEGLCRKGVTSLKRNEAAVVTFAGGMGSRWSHGANVVKAINPFVRMAGRFRTFIEIHLAKSRKTGELARHRISHILTTSYLTHDAIERFLKACDWFGYKDNLFLSPSRSIGRRVYPMERDLRFSWQDSLQQKLDENAQKVLDSVRAALTEWARSRGEGTDYSENDPMLRFNPPGHWHEIPNLIRNGTLARILRINPGLKYLLCHNIDTLGAFLDPFILGTHIHSGAGITFEVTPRRIEDSGGGLAKVNGRLRLVEGPALPREEDEFSLRYYNTLTNWITIDSLLRFFGLDRTMLLAAEHDPAVHATVMESIFSVEKKLPAYVTLKNVKYIWGSGQEDTYPVAQFEKLWGDITALDGMEISYISVPRCRGQQLKEPSLLDVWANDGSMEYVRNRCSF